MAIRDIIECKLITTWKKSNAQNNEIRKFINFDAIRITEDFQKLNENADLQATINARSFRSLNSFEKKDFLKKHSRNLVVKQNEDGTYNLLTGLISYETLKKIYESRAFGNEKYLNQLRETAAEEEVKKKMDEMNSRLQSLKNIRVYVTEYENREQFILNIRKFHDLLLNVNLEYIVIPEYKDEWKDEIESEILKLQKEIQYNPILNGILNEEKITLLDEKSEFLFWAIKKSGRETAKIRLSKLNHESNNETLAPTDVSYDDSAFEIDF